MTKSGLGTSAQDASQLKLTYNYGMTSNNGNVLSQTTTAPNLNLTQSFTYDQLNRLTSALEKQGTGVVWRQNYTYDRYGNRRIDEATTTSGMVGLNPQISTATNRINEAGYTYDAVGNLTRDELDHTYQYDAESRLVSFSAATSASYSYDGAGQRVKKVVGTGSLAVTTTFVYDAGGQLVAEYATNTGGSATGTSYVTMDRLGSTRLLTQGVIPRGGQAAKARYDYLPFGEEISTSYGNRSQAPAYNVEGIRQKYTGYERDIESGLDFAQARYYANAQGRFISADSVAGTAMSPQTLNRYAYTGNNPLNNVDPSGHVFHNAQLNGYEGSGFGYPDHYHDAPSDDMAEINRIKGVIFDNQCAAADAEAAQQQQQPPKPPQWTKQELDEMISSAQQTSGGPLTPQGTSQNTTQNPINVSELVDPPPLYPPQELAHCNPDVIKMIGKMRSATLLGMGTGLKQEAGFRVDPKYKVGELQVGKYSAEVNVPVIPYYTWSKFHTHIAFGGPNPSSGDITNANETKVVVYILSKQGFRLYNPHNPKFSDGSLRVIVLPPCPK